MNQLYEKRSVEKDGLPEKEHEFYFCWLNNKHPQMVMFYGKGKDMEWHTNPGQPVTHYLVPVSERAGAWKGDATKPAPAAPDKGEEWTGEGVMKNLADAREGLLNNSSVEKSEGEVVKNIWNKHMDGLQYKEGMTLGEILIATRKAGIAAMIEYAHSSGDRGRKEWPEDEEIEAWFYGLFGADCKKDNPMMAAMLIHFKAFADWIKTRSGK